MKKMYYNMMTHTANTRLESQLSQVKVKITIWHKGGKIHVSNVLQFETYSIYKASHYASTKNPAPKFLQRFLVIDFRPIWLQTLA